MLKIIKGEFKNENINAILEQLSLEQKNLYIERLIKLHSKEYLLYTTKFHGIYHSEKVMLFAYLIGLTMQKNGYPISDEDLEILLDAGAYHDIGRESDFEDEFHGLVSANFYEKKKVFSDNKLYDNKTNFKILQAITDYHSQNDTDCPKRIEINFYNYDIGDEEFERYTLLAKILKDADALDRKRFPDFDPAGLNIDYLRFKESRDLVELATEINQIYRIDNAIKPNPDLLTWEEGQCLHSIGYDFFKIPSILENGILCLSKIREKDLDIRPNFTGGNGKYFISVVPTRLYHSTEIQDDDACQNFINKGITFLCSSQKLYEPLDNKDKDKAMEQSLPYDKSEYEDERFVYLEIKPEDIASIIILKDIGDMKIKDAQILYNNFNVESIKEKIRSFFNNICFERNIPDLNILFEKYNKTLENYRNFSREKRIENTNKLAKLLNTILASINKVVVTVLNDYYANILNKKEPLIIDIVIYELRKNGYNYEYTAGDYEYIFDIKKVKKLTKHIKLN